MIIIGRALATGVAAILVLSGCAGTPEERDAAASEAPTTTESPAARDSTADNEDGATSSEAGPTEATEGTEDEPGAEDGAADGEAPPADEFSTEDRSGDATSETVTELTSVVVEGNEQYEVISFATGAQPAWSVRYVPVVEVEGEPVLVSGESSMEVVLTGVDPRGKEGYREDVAVNLSIDQEILQELRLASFIGDELIYAIGVSRQVPFRVIAGDGTLTIELQRTE